MRLICLLLMSGLMSLLSAQSPGLQTALLSSQSPLLSLRGQHPELPALDGTLQLSGLDLRQAPAYRPGLRLGTLPFTAYEKRQSQDFDPGAFYAGLVLSLSVTSNDPDQIATTAFFLQPCFTYFLTSRLALTGALGLDYDRRPLSGDRTFTTSLFFLQIGLRYYYPLFMPDLFFFNQLALQIGFGAETLDLVNEERRNSITSFRLGLSSGLAYSLSQRLLVEVTLGNLAYGLRRTNPEAGEAFSRSNFALAWGMKSLLFGLQVRLNGPGIAQR